MSDPTPHSTSESEPYFDMLNAELDWFLPNGNLPPLYPAHDFSMVNAESNSFSTSDDLFAQGGGDFSSAHTLDFENMLDAEVNPNTAPMSWFPPAFGTNTTPMATPQFPEYVDETFVFGAPVTSMATPQPHGYVEGTSTIDTPTTAMATPQLAEYAEEISALNAPVTPMGTPEFIAGIDEALSAQPYDAVGDNNNEDIIALNDQSFDFGSVNYIGAISNQSEEIIAFDVPPFNHGSGDDFCNSGNLGKDTPSPETPQSDDESPFIQQPSTTSSTNHQYLPTSQLDTTSAGFGGVHDLFNGIDVDSLFGHDSTDAKSNTKSYVNEHGLLVYECSSSDLNTFATGHIDGNNIDGDHATGDDYPPSEASAFAYPTPDADNDVFEEIVAGAVKEADHHRAQTGRGKTTATRGQRRSQRNATATGPVQNAKVSKSRKQNPTNTTLVVEEERETDDETEEEEPAFNPKAFVADKLKMGHNTVKAQKESGVLAQMMGQNIRIIPTASGRVKIEGVYWEPPKNDFTIPQNESAKKELADTLVAAIINAQDCKEVTTSKAFKNRWGREAFHYTMEEFTCVAWDVIVSRSFKKTF
jgi:hypothetical protein